MQRTWHIAVVAALLGVYAGLAPAQGASRADAPTPGSRLSPQQVNAFYQHFVGKNPLVDRLLVERSAPALTQAAGVLNDTIAQLASAEPLSTIYEEVQAGARAVPEAHTSSGVVPEQCQPVTFIEVVHRVNGSNVTDRIRLTDDAAAVPALALRSFQVAANHYGTANVVSSRPITQVQCFPMQAVADKPMATQDPPNASVCVDWQDWQSCTQVTPSHTYDYDSLETCTVNNEAQAMTMNCEDSGVIVTRNGDVVLTINTQTLRDDIAARTQALRRLVGDANVITNFHFDVVITPEQQAAIVGNSAFNSVAQAIKQAADAGQPLPDISQLLRNLPDQPVNVDFYNQLQKAYEIKQERLRLLAQITNGALLSAQQVNAFYANFIDKSKLVDKLNVQHTTTSLNQATSALNDTINQLATTDPTSTVYNQLQAAAQSLLSAHTSEGVFDPDKKLNFVVPNLHQFLTSQDLEKRLVASKMLIDVNEQLRQSGGAQRVRDMTPALKMMVPTLQTGDMDTVWRLYDQVQATEFFFDHTDPAGTSYDIHLTPEAQALFNITVQPTSAKEYEVINVLNEAASYNALTGQVTVNFQAIIGLNTRSALATNDLYRAMYHTEESWGVLSFLKNAAGGIVAAALTELGIEATGIIDIIGAVGWTGVETIFDHLTAGLVNWHQAMDIVLQQGGELIHNWPGMTLQEKAELVARIAGEIVKSLPQDLAADRLQEAIERAVRTHLDKAARGLDVISRSHVRLQEDAAVELVKQLEDYDITTTDEVLEAADALDDKLPCDIVGTFGGALAAKPPCTEAQIRAAFQEYKARAKELGFTTHEDAKDLMTSNEHAFPFRIVKNALRPDEFAFAEKIVEREGGVLVGARGIGRDAIDGFYKGLPMQLKATVTTPDMANMLAHVGDAWQKAAKIRDLNLYIRCEQFERQAVIDALPGRFIVDHYLLDGRIRAVHFLTNDGWLDILHGVIQ